MARLLRFTVVRGNYGKHLKGTSFDLLEDSEAAALAKQAAEGGRLKWKPVAGHVPRAPRGQGEVPHGGIARHVVAIFAGFTGALRGAVEAAGKLPREEREQLAQLLRDNRAELDGLLANLPLMEAGDKALALPAGEPPRADRRNPRNVVSPEAARELGAVEAPTGPVRSAATPPAPPAPPAPVAPPAPPAEPEASSGTPTEGGRPRASNPLPKPVDEMNQAEAVAALKSALASSDDYTTSVLILLGRKAGLPMPGLSGKKKDVVVGALRDLLLGEEEDGNAGDEAAATPPAPPAPPEQPPAPPAASGDAP